MWYHRADTLNAAGNDLSKLEDFQRTLSPVSNGTISMKRCFTTVLTAALICVAGCRDDTAQPSATENTQLSPTVASGEQNSELNNFGDFSFSVPKGWNIVAPDRGKTKAMLLLDGTDWQNAKAMIKIDVGTPTAPSAKQLADGLANSAGGTVSTDSLDFDGTPGVSASTSSTTLNTPRDMTIIYRNGKAYLLMAGAIEGVELSKAISHVRKSWKWTE